MSATEEYPHGQVGERWLGNAEVYERHRYECVKQAERDRKAGNVTGAEAFERYAEEWRQRRDYEQRREEMRQLNRRAHRHF